MCSGDGLALTEMLVRQLATIHGHAIELLRAIMTVKRATHVGTRFREQTTVPDLAPTLARAKFSHCGARARLHIVLDPHLIEAPRYIGEYVGAHPSNDLI